MCDARVMCAHVHRHDSAELDISENEDISLKRTDIAEKVGLAYAFERTD